MLHLLNIVHLCSIYAGPIFFIVPFFAFSVALIGYENQVLALSLLLFVD